MGSQPKAVSDAVSRKMLIVIIAMLAIILLPATMMSLPLSRIVLTVSNLDTGRSVSVMVTVYEASDGHFDFILTPGEERSVSCPVTAGTHGVYLRYWFSEGPYYGDSIFKSCSVSLFETEEVEIKLYNYS